MISVVILTGLNLLLLLACWCCVWEQKWSLADRLLGGFAGCVWLIVAAEMALGASGALRREVLLGIFLLPVGGTLWWKRGNIARVVGDVINSTENLWRLLGWWGRLPVLALIGLGVWTALWILWLPTIDWDGQWYHLPIAFSRYQTASLESIPSYWPHFITGYPEVGELLILWPALWLHHAWLSDGVQYAFLVFGAVATYSLGRKLCFARDACLWGATAWAYTPIVVLQARSAHVDLMVAALFLIGLNFVVMRPSSWLATGLVAASAGLLGGIKYGALIYSAVLGALWFWIVGRPTLRRMKTRRWLIYVVLWVVVSAVGWAWYTISAARYGNPVWPLDISVGPVHLAGPLTIQWQDGNMHTPLEIIGLPKWQQFVPVWLEIDNRYLYAAAANGFGPQWWTIGLPGIVFWLFHRGDRDAWWLVGASVLILAVSPWAWQTRYVMFLPAVGALGMSSVLTYATRWGKTLVRLLLTVSLFYIAVLTFDSPTWAGTIRRHALLPLEWRRATFSPAMDGAFRWLDQNTRQPARIGYGGRLGLIGMLWGEDLRHRVFYVDSQDIESADYLVAVIGSPQDELASQDQRFNLLLEDTTGVKTLQVRLYRYLGDGR